MLTSFFTFTIRLHQRKKERQVSSACWRRLHSDIFNLCAGLVQAIRVLSSRVGGVGGVEASTPNTPASTPKMVACCAALVNRLDNHW